MTNNENYHTNTLDMVRSNKQEFDDIPDYNVAFPQLISNGNTFFATTTFNGNGLLSYSTSTKNDEERRRKLALHEKLVTTKIIEIPPDDRISENSRINTQRNANTTVPMQKICTRIQKETSTNITFFCKDQTLIVTITGRPDHVRIAQVQIVRELQKPIKISVHIPLDFHRFIIGQRGTTLRTLEQETLTRIAVPRPDSQTHAIVVTGAKDNVKLCEQKIIELYHIQLNKGFERLLIPCLYHPWIRYQLVDDLQRQFNVSIDLPPTIKQIDEISIKGEREPVEQAKIRILEFYQNFNGKIMTFPMDIPCQQHRFILGKNGCGLKEIFDKTNCVVQIPHKDENCSTIQVMGETNRIGDAITMIYKMANALTAIEIQAPQWMHSVVKGERNANIALIRKSYVDVQIYFRDNHIYLEGPPEQIEYVRKQIQTVIDDLRNTNTTYLEIDIDPQYYKQLIGKNQIRLIEIQEQTGCDIKFPFDENHHHVKLMGSKESVDKARDILFERVQKLSNERTTDVVIDPQYYSQIIGSKGKKLDEMRAKFHNIQIRFPNVNDKSSKVTLHGDKDDVEKCSKFLQQKIKDFYSIEFEISKRLYPLLIGKNGSNIQRLREQISDVRIDISTIEDEKTTVHIRLNGKKIDVDKARKLFDQHIEQLQISLENSIDLYLTIDSKWHVKFFQNQRKLLIELQKQYGDMLIKLPEKTIQSNQVLLRGPKQTVEQVQQRIEQLVDQWENTITHEMAISHRHYGYLLAHGGVYIQSIQKQFNVQIKFPSKTSSEQPNLTHDDQVKITGRKEHVDQAVEALEKMIPIEVTLDIPYEIHHILVGENESELQTLCEQYPDVLFIFPPLNSTSNLIYLKGQIEHVEAAKTILLERYEKYQLDQQARSYQLHFTIKSKYRSIIIGPRRRTLNHLMKTYDVNIHISNHQMPTSAIVPTTTAKKKSSQQQQYDDQQAISFDDNRPTSSDTISMNEIEIIIIGYEIQTKQCRDEIIGLIKDFESKITMEIDIDHRIHARIIGSGGMRLQDIQKKYDVEIKFPSNNDQRDQVHVIGHDQTKIDECIESLLILEDDFLQDISLNKQKQTEQTDVIFNQQQEVPSTNHFHTIQPTIKHNKQQKQPPFQVKNAPWTMNDENSYQMKTITNKNAPNRNDLDEYPLFDNGLTLTTDDNPSTIHETTHSTIPIIWGPPKRKK